MRSVMVERQEPVPPLGDPADRTHGPMRQCAACRRRAPARRLLRWAVGPRSEVVADVYRRLPGRGVHTCAAPACIRNALSRGALSRVLREPVHGEAEQLMARVAEALIERSLQLLGIGRRSGQVRYGADETHRSISDGRAQLLWLAADGSERTQREARGAAGMRGVPVVVALSMAQLGQAMGQRDVAVLAVESQEMGADLKWWLETAAQLGQVRVEAPRSLSKQDGDSAGHGKVESIDGGA